MPSDQGGMDGRVAVGVARVNLSRCGDQNFDGLQVSVSAGKMQRRVVVRQQAFIDDRPGGFDIWRTPGGGEEKAIKDGGDVASCERLLAGDIVFFPAVLVAANRGKNTESSCVAMNLLHQDQQCSLCLCALVAVGSTEKIAKDPYERSLTRSSGAARCNPRVHHSPPGVAPLLHPPICCTCSHSPQYQPS